MTFKPLCGYKWGIGDIALYRVAHFCSLFDPFLTLSVPDFHGGLEIFMGGKKISPKARIVGHKKLCFQHCAVIRSWLFLWRSEWRTNFKNSPGGNGHNSLTIRHTDLCLVPNESSHQALSNGVLGRTYRGLVLKGLKLANLLPWIAKIFISQNWKN